MGKTSGPPEEERRAREGRGADDERDERDGHGDLGVRGRARDALERLEGVIEADVAEARAVAPLVEDAEAVSRSLRDRAMRWLPVAGIALLAAIVVGSGAYEQLTLANLSEHHGRLLAWVSARPVLAALALVASIATILSTGLPGGVVFTVAAGLFFGTVIGGLLAAVGDVIGGTILYFAARQFFASGSKPPAMVDRIRAGFARNPVSFAFFIRLVPVFPFGAISVALAWLGCRFPLFLVATTLGVLPSCFVYAALGAGLSTSITERRDLELSLFAEPRFAIPLLALAVLALIPVMLGFRRGKPAA
ncbi:MAG TPA: VTT domain-containing protein [Candidatus Saccharimonadia bacterium]|nr:VTT domain-containing protein [Candidatus Saccharimonadia bacterium]